MAMIKSEACKWAIALMSGAALAGCATVSSEIEPGGSNPDEIVLGNGTDNRIVLDGLTRVGPTFVVPQVMAAENSFLVLHAVENDKAVRDDYVGAKFVAAGTRSDVTVTMETTPTLDDAFIIMLHEDANGDRMFDFGDGVTVPDAPVFEGKTMSAARVKTPADSPVTPAIIRASAEQNGDLSQHYMERSRYREDGVANRIKAVAHQWMSIAEEPSQRTADARALFADEFQINFSSGPITTDEDLREWLLGPASSVDAARHILSDTSITPVTQDRYRLDFTTDWDGLTKTGERMTAKTAHIWYLIDRGPGKLPSVETIDVEILAPFAPAEWEN